MSKISNGGDVAINASTLGGDVDIRNNGGVTLSASSARLESVLLFGNQGAVVVGSSCDFILMVIENGDVSISGNNEADAVAAGAVCDLDGFGLRFVDVSKNVGGVSIVDNTGEFLTCADNSPAPTGFGNSFSFIDGQCVGL